MLLLNNPEKWHMCIVRSHLDVIYSCELGLKPNWLFLITLLVSRKLTKFLCIRFSNTLEKCDKIYWSVIGSDIFSTRLKNWNNLSKFQFIRKTPF